MSLHFLPTLYPPAIFAGITGPGSTFNTNHRLNGPTIKLAAKFYARFASPIVSVNPFIGKTGTVTGMTFDVAIHADSSDVPGSVLGAASSAWSGPAANGYIGNKTLGTNTGTLTPGDPYWIVVTCASGTPDASNYLEFFQIGPTLFNNAKFRVYNGSDWTTVGAYTSSPNVCCGFTHDDASVSGIVISTWASASATDVFGTNRQGLRFRLGSQATIWGAMCYTAKAGSPSALEILCFEGATQKGTTGVIPAVDINAGSFGAQFLMLGSPATIAPDTDAYLFIRQASDGGSDSADYKLVGYPIPSGYEAVAPSRFRFVSGTGNDPTAFTVNDGTFFPRIVPILTPDIEGGLDSVGGGGGGVTRARLPSGLSGVG